MSSLWKVWTSLETPEISEEMRVSARIVDAETCAEEQRELNRTMVEEACDHHLGKYMKEILLEQVDELDLGLSTAAEIEAALDACDKKVDKAELIALQKIYNEVSKGHEITINEMTAAEAAKVKAKNHRG